ncbi:MAG: hypothetical protein AAGB26_03855 [Planctomycetota bacterium]
MNRVSTLATALLPLFTSAVLAQPDLPAAQPPAQPVEEAVDPPANLPVADPAIEPKPKLVLRELLVVQADRYDDTANNPKLLDTALPADIKKTGRKKSTTNQEQYRDKPMPLGILTFQGTIEEPLQLRLKLTGSTSQFQAYFPDEDAIVGNQLLEWKEVREADDTQRAEVFGEQGAWLTTLRESDDRLWLRSRDPLRKERFVLYDASFRFKPNIDLRFANDRYSLKKVKPERAAPPLSVLLRKSDRGWIADTLAGPWSQPSGVIAKSDSDNAAVSTTKQALAPITDWLAERGYNKQETELALGMIASAKSDQTRLSLIYIMPVGAIEDYVQLRVKPEPDRVIRTAIVVVNNVDPNLNLQVNALLDDLGSDEWAKRDRAQRELIALGQAAIQKVRQLKNNQDPEIAFRAQQILDTYDWKMNSSR